MEEVKMRRISIMLIILITVLSVAACSKPAEPQVGDNSNGNNVTLKAKIIDINEASLLVANMAKDAGPADIYKVNIGKTDIKAADGSDAAITDLKTGMLIDIVFDGTVMESFPMQLGNIERLIIKSQGEDIAGLYKKVIDDLYQVDPGLNDNISILAFDFTKVTNITEAEKSALIYLIGNTYKMEAFAATYDELCEQGYIDKDKLYFEKGLLFSIEDTAITNKSFIFNASKWRSGLGAYFFHDCTATKTGDGWDYTIGAEMIS
jgi:hypothetical protein